MENKEDLNLALRNGTAEISVNGKNRPSAIKRLQIYQVIYGDFKSFKQVGIYWVGKKTIKALQDKYILPYSTEEDESEIMPLHTKRVICNKVFQNKYVSKEEFQNIEANEDELLFLHVNIRGMETNFRNLKDFIKPLKHTHSPDVICVSETRNPDNIERFSLSLYYSLFRSTSGENGKGGVAVYVNKALFNPIEYSKTTLHIPGCESVWIEFGKKDNRFVVGCLYVHCSLDEEMFEDFVIILKEVIEGFNNEKKKVYILGDFNINMLSTKIKSQDLADTFHDVECKLLITKPTRVDGDTKTLIDHIYTNDEINQIVRVGVVETKDLSDHYPVFCIAKWSHLNEPNCKFIESIVEFLRFIMRILFIIIIYFIIILILIAYASAKKDELKL